MWTTVLSRWWRPLWHSVPLNLTVDYQLCDQDSKRVATVSKILATYTRPARRLSIGSFHPNCKVDAKLDKWFLSPVLNHLEELMFEGGQKPRSLLPSALCILPKLHIATFVCCYFPRIDATPALLLPRLKHLELYDVVFSNAAIHRLLAGYTALEGLQIQGIHGFSSLRIVSPNLRTIGVSCLANNRGLEVFEELVIEDAPCIERLILLDPDVPTEIRVIDAPKLTVLGYMCNDFSQLVIGAITVEKMIPTSLTRSLRTVKILVLNSIGPNLDAVVRFLGCFLCTEKLYIQSEIDVDIKNMLQYNMHDPIECLDLHLREISLDNYRGKTPEINFAKFFVLNAIVLKVMRFCIKFKHNDRWWDTQHRRLQLTNRASRGADFQFRPLSIYFDKFGLGGVKMVIHDMSAADPTAASL